MKTQVDKVEAIPSKRIFLSIIADYDLNRSICELVDNALDVWARGGKKRSLFVKITLDKRQQTVTVKDNAGGIAKSELRYVVGPGQTGTNPEDESIGIFGVGTKRAVVALAQDVRIKTRQSGHKTFQIEFDDNWLREEDDWELPVYEVDAIAKGTTIVELQRLRIQVTDEAVEHLTEHLAATYAMFLKNGTVRLELNGVAVHARFFENWAFPPRYPPQMYKGTLKTEDGMEVGVEVTAGLSRESSPATGEYGVYFYCNDRLIARGLKTFEVGFTRGLAGLPHPKVSLTRVLVVLNGDTRCMPWNSSKSDINAKHEVFVALRDWLVQVVKSYASLSRIWMGDWPAKVFRHKTGTIRQVLINDFPAARKSFLPPLPKSRPRYSDVVSQKNRRIAKQKPWTRGLYEGIVAGELIARQPLQQRNRIALIVFDSTLEIAFKEYLVNDSGTHYTDAQILTIFAKRHLVHNEVQKHVAIRSDTWKKINHYYNLRCKLVHERATVNVSDEEISEFRDIVERVLHKLYRLNFPRD